MDNNSCECISKCINDGLSYTDPFRSEFILDEFGPSFRRKTDIDPFLRTVGVAGYVSAILVPELAVMLIMEDMRIDEKMAQDMFYKSAKVGELLNEETTEM